MNSTSLTLLQFAGDLRRYTILNSMRITFTFFLLFAANAVLSEDLPDLVCQEVISETIIPETWGKLGDSKVRSLYKFSSNNLYLSSSTRKEYLYNKVVKKRAGR